MKRLLISAFALAATASFSFAQVQQRQTPPSGQTGAQQRITPQQQQQQQQMNQREQMDPQHVQKCLREAASDNQYEITAGKFIEQRSQDPQVKQFAQRLAQDHQQAQQQLQQLARTARQPMQGTEQMDTVHQAKLQELQQKQGPELDRAFVFGQVGDHEKDVLMAQWQAQHEMDPQLKQYAQQQLPVLEEHLRLARQIAEQWVPQARQAGESLPGQQQPGVQQPGRTNQGTTGGTTGTGRNSTGR